MRSRTLAEVLRPLRGEVCSAPRASTERAVAELSVTGVAIDSREVGDGDLFFALDGDNTCGLYYVDDAVRAGAVAVVTDRAGAALLQERKFDAVPVVATKDPAAALGRLTEAVRLEERELLPAAAITGSVGKTTTCRFASMLLAQCGVVHRPPSSFNNHLGVPLTVLNAPARCDYLITEVGTNGAGEVFRYAGWVKPRVAVVTAIAPAHLEGLLDLEHVAIEKLSILETLEEGGQGWIPVEVAEQHGALLKSLGREVRTFGPGGDLEVRSNGVLGQHHTLILRDRERRVPFRWPAPFPHSPRNLEAALAVGLGFGVDPDVLLENVESLLSPPLRGEVRRHAGVDFVLDCYNANPASLESAIVRLENEPVPGRRVCVIGTMEELGAEEENWHQQLGGKIARANLDDVFLIGRGRDWYAHGFNGGDPRPHCIDDDESSAELLASRLTPGDCVLFKASRRERLEDFAARVADVLEKRGAVVE